MGFDSKLNPEHREQPFESRLLPTGRFFVALTSVRSGEIGCLMKILTCVVGICGKIEAPWEVGGEVEDLVRVI